MAINKTGTDCCGCTACAAVCPKDAINMVADPMGFKYPKVDYDKCIECGLCEKTCSFTDSYKTPDNFSQPIPYGARLKDINQLMKSRSGGAFVAFSDWILDKGGVIYGAGYKGHFIVSHKRAINSEQRDEFRGSKYVQSNLDEIFRAVKTDLEAGLWVLFSGTPCQTSGLQSFIPEKLKEKLVTVDIVCHGVPSPQIWQDYIHYLEDKERKFVIGVEFRDKKRFGWKAHKETITLAEPQTTVSTDIYTHLFFKNIMHRPSCGECKYCNIRRPADLTLADFWGWEKTGSHINDDDKGLSLVFVNTPKGKNIFDTVSDRFYVIQTSIENCMQSHLKSPTKLNPLYIEFANDYAAHGFKYVLRKYGNVGIRHKAKTALSLIKRIPLVIIRLFK